MIQSPATSAISHTAEEIDIISEKISWLSHHWIVLGYSEGDQNNVECCSSNVKGYEIVANTFCVNEGWSVWLDQGRHQQPTTKIWQVWQRLVGWVIHNRGIPSIEVEYLLVCWLLDIWYVFDVFYHGRWCCGGIIISHRIVWGDVWWWKKSWRGEWLVKMCRWR